MIDRIRLWWWDLNPLAQSYLQATAWAIAIVIVLFS